MNQDTDDGEAVALLREIRDNQVAAIEGQRQVLQLLQEQADHSRQRVAESIELQKVAVARQKHALVGGLPLIVICLVLIGYLVWTYF